MALVARVLEEVEILVVFNALLMLEYWWEWSCFYICTTTSFSNSKAFCHYDIHLANPLYVTARD
jgi:hypothetical protein